jgi:hypothetical protein
MIDEHKELMNIIRLGNAFCSLEAELCGKTKEESMKLIEAFDKKWYPNKETT